MILSKQNPCEDRMYCLNYVSCWSWLVWAAVIAYFLRYCAVSLRPYKIGPALRDPRWVSSSYNKWNDEGSDSQKEERLVTSDCVNNIAVYGSLSPVRLFLPSYFPCHEYVYLLFSSFILYDVTIRCTWIQRGSFEIEEIILGSVIDVHRLMWMVPPGVTISWYITS